MSKAEDLAKQYKECREQCGIKDPVMLDEIEEAYFEGYNQARRTAEIAREEIYKWLRENMYMYNGECEGDRKAIIDDLKQAMKDE